MILRSESVQRVRAALERAGVRAEIVELPGAARTAKAAAEFLGCEVAQIANSLVFRAESSDAAVLVMSSGGRARSWSVLSEPDRSARDRRRGKPVESARADSGVQR